jgi:hypothetical protein
MNAYLTFEALTREIGTKIRGVNQNGFWVQNFGAKWARICGGFFRLMPFARIDATTRRVYSQAHMPAWDQKYRRIYPKASLARLPR